MTQRPYLNLGCGRVILPNEQPGHHSIVEPAIYNYPLWVNADRNDGPGVDCVTDLFTYPWPWDDNSFDGALLAHIVEHIPHEIRLKPTRESWLGNYHSDNVSGQTTENQRNYWLSQMQDGWYAFFSELYRVLTPGSVAHILSPYAWSQGAMTDPTHTRWITEQTFTHSMRPEPDGPFKYANGGIYFELVMPPRFKITELYQHLVHRPELLEQALMTQVNVAYDIYAQLRAVKDD